MKKDGADASAVATVTTVTPQQKQKYLNEFASKGKGDLNAIEEEVSVNHDGGEETQALLSGDANEELRMADRLQEKKTNAQEGKMPRVTVNDLRPSQRESRDKTGPQEEEKSNLLI